MTVRLDVIEIREDYVTRTVSEEVEVLKEVPIRVGSKNAETGELEFTTRYEMRPFKEVVRRVVKEPKTFIEFAAPGRRAYQTTVKSLAEIKAIQDCDPNEEDADDKMVEMQKRDFLLAWYEAKKKGNQLPTNGTPIGAWGAIDNKVAEAFRNAGIAAIEEVAELTEQAKARLGHIGHLNDLIKQAKAFVGSADKLAAATHMKELESQNTALKDQLADQEAALKEMHAMLMELKQQAPGASDKPKRLKAEVAA